MKHSPRLRAVVAAVLSTCAAAPVFAQQQQLPEVSVSGERQAGGNYAPANAASATKVDAPLRDIPQTVNVVTQEVARDQGARSLTDVLKNVPGIGLATGDGQRDAFVIRGFTSLYDNYLDGVRDDSQYFRDLYNIERIEIIKGPAGVLYGRGSSGGLINRISKKPAFSPSAELGVTVGSYGLKRTEFDVNRPVSDTLAVRVIGAYEDSGSFRQQGYLKNKDISPSLLWKDGNQSLLLQFDYQYQHRSIDFGIPGYRGAPASVPISTYYGALNGYNDYTQSTTRTSTAQYKLRVSDDTSFTNTFRYSDYALARNHTRVGTINDTLAVPTVSISRGNILRNEHGWYNQSDLSHNVKWGSTSHKLLVGVEVGEQDRFQYINNNTGGIYAYSTALLNPVLQDLPANVTTAAQNRGYAVQVTRAAYAQSLSSWTSTIKTLVGLRYDNYYQKYDDQLPANADIARTDNKVSPRAGVVWQPTQFQSYYASWSRSFQPSSEGTSLATNNANLAPEKTTNIEVGTKLDILDGRASITGAVYQLTRTDIKVTDPSNSALLIPVGEQRTNGLELGLSGELARGWQLIAGYSYMDGKVTKAVGTVTAPFTSAVASPLQGKTLALTPRHTASLWTLKSLDQFGLPGFQVGGGITYRGENYAAVDNAVKLPSFATVDLAGFYRPSVKGVSLALNFKNIFNKVYYISANNDSGIMPGAPRTVELTARYKF